MDLLTEAIALPEVAESLRGRVQALIPEMVLSVEIKNFEYVGDPTPIIEFTARHPRTFSVICCAVAYEFEVLRSKTDIAREVSRAIRAQLDRIQ
jgi:hypothetical protein